MAEITAKMVKELREQTGAGMMDCKRALGDTGGVYFEGTLTGTAALTTANVLEAFACAALLRGLTPFVRCPPHLLRPSHLRPMPCCAG
jgi:hypothetical protein